MCLISQDVHKGYSLLVQLKLIFKMYKLTHLSE